MRIGHLCLAAACVVAAAIDGPAYAQRVATASQVAVPAPLDLSRYEKDIVAFETADRATPPPQGAILFVGSSIFRQWANLATHMAPLPVFNRAFGGSRTAEQVHYMDRIVLPYKPRVIVYYCGSNDVNADESAAAIASRYEAFSERVRQVLPGTRVYFASIIRAPQKRDRWAVVDDANARVREYSARTPGRGYIDLHPALEASAATAADGPLPAGSAALPATCVRSHRGSDQADHHRRLGRSVDRWRIAPSVTSLTAASCWCPARSTVSTHAHRHSHMGIATAT